ncbi:hypothetical protein D3C73_390040 [compost metagenome]
MVHGSDTLSINESRLPEPLRYLYDAQIIGNRGHARSILKQAAAAADQTITILQGPPNLPELHAVYSFYTVHRCCPFRVDR